MPFEFQSLTVYVPGEGDHTCFQLYSAAWGDDGAVEGTSTSGTFDAPCSVLKQAGAGTCCRPTIRSCDICGPGKFVDYYNNGKAKERRTLGPKRLWICMLVFAHIHFHCAETEFTDPYLGTTLSCSDVHYGSYMDGSIADKLCSTTKALAAEVCCESIPGYIVECLVCGPAGIAFPDLTLTSLDGESTVSCNFFGSYSMYFNESECEYATSLASPCCAPTSSPSFSPVGALEPGVGSTSTVPGSSGETTLSSSSSSSSYPRWAGDCFRMFLSTNNAAMVVLWTGGAATVWLAWN
jgi:hypothetical protein